jgi:hypothetical protein
VGVHKACSSKSYGYLIGVYPKEVPYCSGVVSSNLFRVKNRLLKAKKIKCGSWLAREGGSPATIDVG